MYTTFYHSIELTRIGCLMEVSTMFYICRYCIFTWYSTNNSIFVTFVHFLLQPVEAGDDAFWDQFWADTVTSVTDVFALIPAAEIRALREESPSNLATLCYKARSGNETPRLWRHMVTSVKDTFPHNLL